MRLAKCAYARPRWTVPLLARGSCSIASGNCTRRSSVVSCAWDGEAAFAASIVGFSFDKNVTMSLSEGFAGRAEEEGKSKAPANARFAPKMSASESRGELRSIDSGGDAANFLPFTCAEVIIDAIALEGKP